MLCPRCEQDQTTESRGRFWICLACALQFTECTRVIRPIERGSIWVERGSGSIVTVMEVDGDSFDPLTSIRYTDEANRNVMTAEDFRYYFRLREGRQREVSYRPPCKPHEEWESLGNLYLVLEVLDDSVHVVPANGSPTSFWIRGIDFERQFRKFQRRTDYARLLEDA